MEVKFGVDVISLHCGPLWFAKIGCGCQIWGTAMSGRPSSSRHIHALLQACLAPSTFGTSFMLFTAKHEASKGVVPFAYP